MRLTHTDKIIIAEFICIVLATLLFVAGTISYVWGLDTYKPVWIWFAFFMLVKHWLEFWESEIEMPELDELEDILTKGDI